MQEETLPAYEMGSPIKCIHEVMDGGRIVVRLPDESLALYSPLPAVTRNLPWEMSAEYLKAWMVRAEENGTLPKNRCSFYLKLCDDSRMNHFWEWLLSAKFRDPQVKVSSYTVGTQIFQSTKMPNKPGNLPPASRNAYFEKVRKHAGELRELLEDTIFDGSHMHRVPQEDLDKPLGDVLYGWGVEEPEEGHAVAFRIHSEGLFQYHWTYPQSELREILAYLLEWTYWDDQWDGSFFTSSAPIVQANSEGSRAVYFNCTLFDWFQKHGIEMPFPILATVANVALDLSVDKQLDEDTVRKQVRRYQARRAKQNGSDPAASGQNFAKWDDSVLSDPF